MLAVDKNGRLLILGEYTDAFKHDVAELDVFLYANINANTKKSAQRNYVGADEFIEV